MDAINYQLFKQAYNTSVDISKFVDHYEMSKHLTGPYDMEGACIVIRAGSEGTNSELWEENILSMYTKWADKHGCKGRIIEKYPPMDGGTKSVTIEFESKYAFGYLFGERGQHRMIKSSLDGSLPHETSSAVVDVIPLFLERAPELHIDSEDLEISILQSGEENLGHITEHAVSVSHIPTGIKVQCSESSGVKVTCSKRRIRQVPSPGERSHFSKKMKALNRLKAKLLLIATEQGVSSVKNIKREAIADMWLQEVRRYVFHPYKLVQDVKTGIQLPDVTSVLGGNLEPLINAHISIRQVKDTWETS
eukprot:TRINITY_DN33330_c0_g1_i6.p1 TRINITY_DN33330_c0_g1~~TRINITY_DN33330_c0_g1_i6.p1  ORF type:complete len:306 (-),score=54.75 TRINITY_DN33330_c0_g1_i6:659-1576(-)